jgi:hypothetical protein
MIDMQSVIESDGLTQITGVLMTRLIGVSLDERPCRMILRA